ncbi:SLATT domain-containing protein [Pseudomonas sp. 1912-s]|uniref:SLATT domain-containing protein n=1 Tax=Pseudomonas sp. 1912-s TaxID=3033802 RepID=UPI0023DFB3F7|nr:SLATT domain-containing protein [Pseudomonas sp. 1912-s]MDF3199053.1 SLATT domain-containing protein [Pseudomonas sp. 1912-s]
MRQDVATSAEDLRKQVDSFQSNHWKKHRNASTFSVAMVLASVALGASVTLAGFLDQSKLAGMLGIALTSLIGLQDAFNFSEKSSFYAGIHAEAKALRDRLRYLVDDGDAFEKAFEDYQALRIKSAQLAPKGKGVSVASQGS